MDAVVLVPGILGSSLDLYGQEIWPPNRDEALASHYERIQFLLNDDAKPKGIINWVVLPCAQIYAPLVSDLKAICNQVPQKKYIEFPYDWRQDLLKTAKQLSTQLDELVEKNGVKNITIVSHSMGGLVARILFEYGKIPSKWKAKAKVRLLCICTPHRGSPASLSKCMGIEPETTISRKDVKTLCDSDHPTAYELLPPPSKTFVWDVNKKPLDIYQPAIARLLKLSTKNLAAAKTSFSQHDIDNKPSKIEYTFVFGTDHTTEEEFIIDGTKPPIQYDSQGDGTVPTWSASYTGNKSGIVTWHTPGDHVGIFAVQAFKDYLYGYFGMAAPFVRAMKRDTNIAVLSPNKRMYAPGQAMRIRNDSGSAHKSD